MFNFIRFIRKNKNKAAENSNININIDVTADISELSIIALCDEPSKNIPVSPIKHMAKFLKKENNIITLVICLEKNQQLEYCESDTASVMYYDDSKVYGDMSAAKVYQLSAKILRIRLASEIDKFNANGIGSSESCLYTAELEVVSKLRERPFKEFYSADIPFEVCCKTDCFDKSEIDGSISDMRRGYVKFTAVNVNSGGFNFKSVIYIEPEKILKFMILTGYETLPVSVKIAGIKTTEDNKGYYVIRAVFVEVDSEVRTMLAKRVFEYQKKMQAFRKNLLNLKKFYKKIHKK